MLASYPETLMKAHNSRPSHSCTSFMYKAINVAYKEHFVVVCWHYCFIGYFFPFCIPQDIQKVCLMLWISQLACSARL